MRTLSDKRCRAASSEPFPGAGPDAPLILVAEDEESSRSALCEVLRDSGYRVIGVADGWELVELTGVLRPAAVVLDLAMPRLNGMEAAAALRSDPGTRDLRIVAISASWLAERADLLAAGGFDGALRKPCTSDQLVAELRRVLKSGGTRTGAGTTASGARRRRILQRKRNR